MNDCLIFFLPNIRHIFFEDFIHRFEKYERIQKPIELIFVHVLGKKKLFIANKLETIAIYSETYANN